MKGPEQRGTLHSILPLSANRGCNRDKQHWCKPETFAWDKQMQPLVQAIRLAFCYALPGQQLLIFKDLIFKEEQRAHHWDSPYFVFATDGTVGLSATKNRFAGRGYRYYYYYPAYLYALAPVWLDRGSDSGWLSLARVRHFGCFESSTSTCQTAGAFGSLNASQVFGPLAHVSHQHGLIGSEEG